MWARFLTVFVLAAVFATDANGQVSGIVINTRNGTDKLKYYGTIDGELWRHNIDNDVVIESKKIYNGPASRPAISPDGQHIAFIKKTGSATAKVAMINIDGSGEVELADCIRNSLVDFPHDDWVYFTPKGSYHESGSGLIERVNIHTKVVETVKQLIGTDNNNIRVAQLQVSNDLTKAVIRTGDTESAPEGSIVAVDLSATDDKVDQVIGTKYACAAGFFNDGEHVMDGHDAHDGFDIRKYADASLVTSFDNVDAFNWAPNNGAGDPGDYEHAIFNSGASTNANHWMTIVVGDDIVPGGDGRNYKWDSTLLLNWKDKRCIFVTKGLVGPWDHGDFWEGDPGTTVTQDPPTITTQPANATVEVGDAATFTIAANGAAPLSYKWQKNGSDINGATQASYTTPPLALTDSGDTYRCVVSNAYGDATSNDATLTVNPAGPVDTTAPTLVSAQTTAGVNDKVSVMFSEPLSQATAENAAAYGIDNGVTISSAQLDTSGKIVTLSTSTLAEGSYTLTVNDVEDLAGNKIAAASTTQFEHAENATNTAPSVSAGDDLVAYVDIEVTLVGSVLDDGLPSGSTVTTAWSVIEGDADAVKIAELDSAITTVAFSKEGSYTLKLEATDGELSGSDELIAVVKSPQAITLLSPAGGEQWPVGSTQQIRWETVNVEDVYILFSSDDGQNWETIAPSVDTTSDQWGNYAWTVPNTPTDTARIKIEVYGEGGAEAPMSEAFSIVVGDGAGADKPALDGGCAIVALPPAIPTLLLLIALLIAVRRREYR